MFCLLISSFLSIIYVDVPQTNGFLQPSVCILLSLLLLSATLLSFIVHMSCLSLLIICCDFCNIPFSLITFITIFNIVLKIF